ncbi:MAG: NAD(P)-dependent oxidoreductase [Actinomycetota bacterium]
MVSERPSVIVDPAFRRMDEIFDPSTNEELRDRFRVVWGRDEPMPTDRFLAELPSAMAIVHGDWRHGPVSLDGAGLRAVLEVAGGHPDRGPGVRRLVEGGLLLGSCAPAFAAVVAEMALALALAGLRGVVRADREMRSGTERWLHDGNAGNRSLFGAEVGFVGCGGIAARLHDLLRPFEVRVRGYDPPLPAASLLDRGIQPADLGELFDRCDVVFVLAAPTDDNRHLVDRALLSRLGPEQLLVVISRAHLVDFDAMTELAAAGRFRMATDVYPVEPLPAEHPVRAIDDGICVPHLAGALPRALTDIGRFVLEDLVAISEGRLPRRMQYLTAENLDGLIQPRPPA